MRKITSEVIIVGAGAAGCYLSHLLDKKKIPHVIVTDIIEQLSYNVNHKINNGGTAEVSAVRTIHGIGGGTNLWGGGLVELHQSDFEHEYSFGSEKIFERLKDNYQLAWKFFGLDRAQLLKNSKNDEDICVVQKEPLNFAELVSNKSIIRGTIIDHEFTVENRLSAITLQCDDEIIFIQGNKFVLCAGTLGNLKILSKFPKLNDKDFINELKTGIYTHPKATVGLKKFPAHFRLFERSISNDIKVYIQKVLILNGKRVHAIRNENVFVEIFNRFLSLKLPSCMINFLAVFKKILRYLYNLNLSCMNIGKYNLFKVYTKSVKPDYIWHYDLSDDRVNLRYIGDTMRQLNDLNTQEFENAVFDEIQVRNLTLAHTHYFGGLKVSDGKSTFISESGRLEDFDNIWVNGPVILNATGYANPILSILALTHAVYEDICCSKP